MKKKFFSSVIAMVVGKLKFLRLAVCTALLPAVVLGVAMPLHDAAGIRAMDGAPAWVGDGGCKLDSGSAGIVDFGDIRPYNGAKIAVAFRWNCGGPPAPSSKRVNYMAVCALVEASDWLGNRRVVKSADGQNGMPFTLIDVDTGEEIGARRTNNVGNIAEVIFDVRTSAGRSKHVYLGTLGDISVGQIVPEGIYTTALVIRLWWNTSNSLAAAPPAGFNCASLATTPNTIEIPVGVRANVPASCDVAATDVDFGTHVLLDKDLTGRSLLDSVCTIRTPYKLKVLTGDSYPADQKRLKSADGTQYVTYGIYTHGNYTTPWGPDFYFSDTGTGARESKWYVYLKVPKQSRRGIKAGMYSDIVTVNIEY